MDIFGRQFINLLITPPGNLIYYLVLVFSITTTLQAILAYRHSKIRSLFMRMLIGLVILITGQIILFLTGGLAWQGILAPRYFLPPLDRAIIVLSILWIIWLWCFPNPTRILDISTIIISVIIVLFFVYTQMVWNSETAPLSFNGSWFDWGWGIFAIFLIICGMIILMVKRPDGWGVGLSMLALNLAGFAIHLAWTTTEGDFSAAIRYANICSFPLLPSLIQRLQSFSTYPAFVPSLKNEQGFNPQSVKNWLNLAAQRDPDKICNSLTHAIAQTTGADICLLITYSDSNTGIQIKSGYDIYNKREIRKAALDPIGVPTLANALQVNRLQWIIADNNSLPDLNTLAETIQINHISDILIVPLYSKDYQSSSLFFLTPFSKKTWSAAEQTGLMSIAESVAEILDLLIRSKQTPSGLSKLQQYRMSLETNPDISSSDLLSSDGNKGVIGKERIGDISGSKTAGEGDGNKVLQLWLDQVQDENRELSEELERLQKENRELRARHGMLPSTEATEDENTNDGQLSEIPDRDLEEILEQIEMGYQEIETLLSTFQEESQDLDKALGILNNDNSNLKDLIQTLKNQNQAFSRIIEKSQIQKGQKEKRTINSSAINKMISDLFTPEMEEGAVQNDDDEDMGDTNPIQEKEAIDRAFSVDKTQPIKIQAKGTIEEQRLQSGKTTYAVNKGLDELIAENENLIETAKDVLITQKRLEEIANKIQSRYENLQKVINSTLSNFQNDAQHAIEDIESDHQDLRSLLSKTLTAQTSEDIPQGTASKQADLPDGTIDHQAEMQKIIDKIKTENEKLRDDYEKSISKSRLASERTKQVETELRMTLEEVARLESLINSTQQKIQTVENQANQQEQSTMEFSRNIAAMIKDLHQPVASINGYAELLLSETVGKLGSAQQRFLERVKTSTDRLNKLLGELANSTTQERDLEIALSQPIDINAVVDQALTDTTALMDENNIDLRVDLPEEMPKIFLEQDALLQIIVHLLRNAGTVTPPEGIVALQISDKENQLKQSCLLIQVSDSGKGIPPESLSDVFLPKGDDNVNLSIAKTLVEAQGGDIQVKSQTGKGSTFYVTLPARSNKVTKINSNENPA